MDAQALQTLESSLRSREEELKYMKNRILELSKMLSQEQRRTHQLDQQLKNSLSSQESDLLSRLGTQKRKTKALVSRRIKLKYQMLEVQYSIHDIQVQIIVILQGKCTIQIGKQHVEDHANCSVCLSEYKEGESVRKLLCEHLYHSDCIVQWLKVNRTCPLCRGYAQN